MAQNFIPYKCINMDFHADRSFRNLSNAALIPFLRIVGNNISSKVEFLPIQALGTSLLSETTIFENFYLIVLGKDYRSKAQRDQARKTCLGIAMEICTEVNQIANGNPVTYELAGLNAIAKASADRAIGTTEILHIEYNRWTNRVDIRVRKADKAADYRIDIETPEGEVQEEFAAMPQTTGTFPAPKTPGTYRCRVIPRDSKYNEGQPSDWEDFGVS